MNLDLLKIEKLLLEYINIIANEYHKCRSQDVFEKIKDGHKIVEFNSTSSISFFVRNATLYLPKYAYTIFPILKKYENYGIEPDHHRSVDDYLDTNTTYYDYIEHVIKSGMSVLDYFKESLLHEAMHICGSGGGTPLEEGINELKTRELAQKHNIMIAAYGYPKEVEIAKKLQSIIGKKIIDELTFISREKRKDFLLEREGKDIADLYESISIEMQISSKNYNDNITQISDPFEKSQLYNLIDYSNANTKLDNYIKQKTVNIKSYK